ncbi:F-box protein CPR1-like isoform X2 [Salvia hispanica]|uniref:F-box protein CPR1-like isoform X2 n=1 Tax=Salvia hispanica TaxID=49212 RepID=UPI0020091F5F|nr:F-box protein CPR1-like isoform X2 [Salvia hispanica]
MCAYICKNELSNEIKQGLAYDPKMMQDLPPEIITDILLRLPLESIAACKCVCKPWLNVIETDDFVKSHLSKSAPALAVSEGAQRFNVFKLEDEHDLVYEQEHDPIIKFDFPRVSRICVSVNGLLLLKDYFVNHLYVCNPVTREFIELREPHDLPWGDCYGFGVGKISGKHKVVRLHPKSGCHVYTLETGSSWRRVETPPSFSDWYSYDSAFVNGNIHWIVSDKKHHIWCFDVETECFSIFSAPIEAITGKLYTLGDCLCFYDVEGLEEDNVIWLLKEYEQVEKRWTMVDIILQEEAFHGYFYGMRSALNTTATRRELLEKSVGLVNWKMMVSISSASLSLQVFFHSKEIWVWKM